MDLQPHQERVLAEFRDLRDRRDKIMDFIISNPTFLTLSTIEQWLLNSQSDAMLEYERILVMRLSLWGIDP